MQITFFFEENIDKCKWGFSRVEWYEEEKTNPHSKIQVFFLQSRRIYDGKITETVSVYIQTKGTITIVRLSTRT